MTAQRLIAALAAAGFIFAALLLALTVLGFRVIGDSAARAESARERAGIIAELASDANDYGEQVAAVLLFGKGQMDTLGSARVEMERALSRLDQATRAEISRLGGMAEVATELPEVDSTRRMIELYHAIDLSATRALAQQRDGRPADAAQLFQSEVQFRLANELQPLLEKDAVGEQDEIAGEQAALASTRMQVIVGASVLTALAAAVLTALAVQLQRAIARPVAQLRSGFGTIAAGRTPEPLPAAGNDQFAMLTRSFNDMGEAIERRRLELAGLADQLRAEMEARTQQWEEANRSLRAVDERRSQLLADISHQLRTPLTILRGEADVALRGKPKLVEQRQALERVQLHAAELGQLLEDLIAYARSDAESHGHVPADVRLDEVVGAAVREGQALAEPREVTIEASLGDYGSLIHADSRHLRQALVIGFDNAIKHTPPGGRIEVETAAANGAVHIRIMDEGPGVDPEEKPRVFERFFRGRAEADLLNQGLGIGLAIARDIVERHGGTIALDNRAEGGAVLEITLPLPHRFHEHPHR